MVNMLPSTVPDIAPDSEKTVFRKIKSDRGCSDWTVLHSLGLSQRGVKKPYGEIDFVVIVPGEGILCLEVKGGGVKCTGGKWSTTNRHNVTTPLEKSPFDQVRDGMRAVRNRVEAEFGAASAIMRSFFGTAVIFTDVEAPPATVSYEKDEIIDVNDLLGDIAPIIHGRLRSQRRRLGWLQTPSLTDPADVAKLVKLLRPDFELKEARATRIRRDIQALIRLTKEQARFMESCSENKRCLIKGAAGTGKTLMAIEAFRKEATAGNRVGLLCYNKVLGGWFRRELEEYSRDGVVCGSIYECFLGLIKTANLYEEYLQERSRVASDRQSLIFDKIIPEYAIRAIMETNAELDYLILDEAQDLIRPSLLDVFDVWLRGGLKKGRWSIFGDFHNQAIYSAELSGTELLEILERHLSDYATFKLNVNCRNTKNIAESTSLFSGFATPPYETSQIDGEPVNQSFWKNDRDLAEKLIRQISRLLDDGVSPGDIAILSPRKFKNSCTSAIDLDNCRIVDISGSADVIPDKQEITFSTIHSFKGMESPVIILTDIDNIATDQSRSLLYIGMSRASAYLSVFFNEGIRDDLKTVLSKKISAEQEA